MAPFQEEEKEASPLQREHRGNQQLQAQQQRR